MPSSTITQLNNSPTIQAAIFDMDGLLVDSEPIWREVAIEVFEAARVPLTEAMCRAATGLGTAQFVKHIFGNFPGINATEEAIGQHILHLAHERIGQRAEAMPGAVATIRFFYDRRIPLAVASASPMDIIETVLKRLDLRQYFQLWHSALLETRNKPAPDVYLGAARMLGITPGHCLAFEDSGNGLRSAVAAGMRTVAVPADYEFDEPKFDLATLKIPSLLSFDADIFNTLSTIPPDPAKNQ